MGGGIVAPVPLTTAFHNSGTSGNYSLSAMSVTAGNLVVVALGGSDPHTGVSDTQGNTWVGLTEFVQGLSYYTRLFYCLSILSTGTTTISVTSSAIDAGRNALAVQFTGGKVYDGVNVGGTNGSSSFTSNAYTTTAGGIVFCAMNAGGNGTTVTGGTPAFTMIGSELTRPGLVLSLFYRVTTSAQVSQQHTVGGSGATNHVYAFTAFK